jgi:hypothetical protein
MSTSVTRMSKGKGVAKIDVSGRIKGISRDGVIIVS